jgi:uncharacterized membrane protein
MVLMVLDHVREFLTPFSIDPTDPATTYPALFLTRWVTHFCAPVFVFLAGTGAYLAGSRGKSRGPLMAFLATRGLWLIVLELTLVKLGWMFRYDTTSFLFQVIGAIGASMILLSPLVVLPAPAVGVIGVAIVAGHNLFDGHLSGWLTSMGQGSVLFRPGGFNPVAGVGVHVAYPVIPWLGVMAAGYGFGPMLSWPQPRRGRAILALGLALTAAFLALRGWNHYGDPRPWVHDPDGVKTAMSFLNCQKYPPSLLYTLMTLGPALTLLAWFGRVPASGVGPLVTFGRVPLFYYLIQWPLIHLMTIALEAAQGKPIAWLFHEAPFGSPPGYGYPLWVVYLGWVVALVLLYPPCRWFAGLKRRHHTWWLSYF